MLKTFYIILLKDNKFYELEKKMVESKTLENKVVQILASLGYAVVLFCVV